MRGILGLLLVWGSSALAQGTAVNVGADRLFVPNGYDDNDHVQVVLEGRLDSDCYKLDDPDVRIDLSGHEITIQPKASYYQWMCLEVNVPWTRTIDLGKLPSGSYNVKFVDSLTFESLTVKPSTTASPDDHVYAPVDSLSINVNGSQAIAVIKGRFATRCTQLEDVIVTDNGSTIEILPIMTAGSVRNCAQDEQPYERMINLPQKARGRYLVQARSLNGQALNQVYEIR